MSEARLDLVKRAIRLSTHEGHEQKVMVIFAETSAKFVEEVNARAELVYDLLLKAARPTLEYGSLEEVTGLTVPVRLSSFVVFAGLVWLPE